MVGYDVLAYQRFFIQPETAKLMEKNVRLNLVVCFFPLIFG
jgi:hypothetical protein